MKRDLAGFQGEWRMTVRDGGVETDRGNSSKAGSVTEGEESKNWDQSLDFRDKERKQQHQYAMTFTFAGTVNALGHYDCQIGIEILVQDTAVSQHNALRVDVL